MALTQAEIYGIAAKFARIENAIHSTQAVRAAAQSTDTWIDNNQAGFVADLPEPFKSNSNAAQKTELFCYVAMRRAGII